MIHKSKLPPAYSRLETDDEVWARLPNLRPFRGADLDNMLNRDGQARKLVEVFP